MTEAEASDSSRVHNVLAMTLAVVQTQVLHVAAVLGLADLLKDGPLSLAELAAEAKTSPQALKQVMRVLTHLGLMEEVSPGTFRCTGDGELLREDAPHSVRHYAILMGQDFFGRSWPELLHSVRTGESAFEHQAGTSTYEYFRSQPSAGTVMNQAMSELSALEGVAVCDAYDFTAFRSIVDVGGGRGGLLAAVLKAYPDAQGFLIDLTHVAAEAEPVLKASGVADRCTIVGGDFREQVPSDGDLYILKRILVDSTDEVALTVLRNIRAAMRDGARLLIAEPDVETSYGKRLDIFMLMVFGAVIRTEAELAALFDKTGFTLGRTFTTASAIRLTEAVPA